MNRQICRKYVLAFLCPATVMLLVAMHLASRAEAIEPTPQIIRPVEIASAEEPAVTVPHPAFTIGCWQGHVAVFENTDEIPVMVLETPVSSLPEADQTALAEGIAVYDQQMLASILEDYGS